MYCKHCGKQIDDDSRFCKECGKSLSTDALKSTSSLPISKFKPYFLPICFVIIWYALTFVFIFGVYYNDLRYYDESPIGLLVLLWITPLIYYLIYYLINKYGKYPLKLWNDTDKLKTKLFKSAYLTYSYFVPFGCCEKIFVEDYLALLFMSWVIPSLIIYFIYLYRLSQKHKQ